MWGVLSGCAARLWRLLVAGEDGALSAWAPPGFGGRVELAVLRAAAALALQMSSYKRATLDEELLVEAADGGGDGYPNGAQVSAPGGGAAEGGGRCSSADACCCAGRAGAAGGVQRALGRPLRNRPCSSGGACGAAGEP